MSEENKSIPDKIEWTVHPVKKSRWRSTCLILFLIFLFVLIYFAFENIVFVFISVVFLLGSLRRFFWQTKYIFTDDEVIIVSSFGRTSKRWSFFKSFYPDKNGVLLSPFPKKTWLENFRGVYLLWNTEKETIIDFIKTKVK
ncbi:MAG: hypothetical protein KAS70_06795 [Planctomycetes bacterium]|nr:hypothetical protein [Planctomycetota bacterium]